MLRFRPLLLALVTACGDAPVDRPTPPDDPVDGVDTPPLTPRDLPGPTLRRLTVRQHHNALRHLFGEDLVLPAHLEADEIHDGLQLLGAAESTLSPMGVELVETAAQQTAAQLVGPLRDRVVRCAPAATVDADCARQTLAATVRRLWRRSLTEAELSRLTDLAGTSAATLGDFHEGLGIALGAALSSPWFLYRVELGEPDPSLPGTVRFTDLELASRLSFMLWASIPDEALLDAAEAGQLSTLAEVEAQVDRMLDHAYAREGFSAWLDDAFQLYRLDTVTKYYYAFPTWTRSVAAAARAETLTTVVTHVFDLDGDWRDLLTSRDTWLNDDLAALYDLPATGSAQLQPAALPADGPRAGLLGHASLLAAYAHADATSVTRRGRFVREVLLCDPIDPPPPGVDTTLVGPVGDDPRAILDEHTRNPACAGCHAKTDPIGIALENFDAIGRYRDEADGWPIDPSGDLDGVPYADAVGLGAALREHPDLPRCAVASVHTWATGHRPSGDEDADIDALTASFVASGYSMRALLREIAVSEAFRHAGVEAR